MNFGFARVCQRSHNFSHYSLEWLEWCWMRDGKRLKKNLDELGYDATNLLSCMTLDVENLHSVVHHKSGVSTTLQYARDFYLAEQGNRASNEQHRGGPITTQDVGRGTQSERDCWDCLKFHRCHKPQKSKLPKTKSQWWGSGQEHMDLPWRQRSYHGKGWNCARLFVPKGNRSWRKNRPFFNQCGNHRHQLSIQHHWWRRSYRARFKQWWRNLWGY